MGAFATDKNEIILIYNNENSIGKQTYAYVEVADKEIWAIDISKTKVTGMQWVEIAEKLHCKVMDLIEKEHPEFKKIYDNPDADLSTQDAIKVLQNHPGTFIHPVLINGTEFIRIETPSDVAKYVS